MNEMIGRYEVYESPAPKTEPRAVKQLHFLDIRAFNIRNQRELICELYDLIRRSEEFAAIRNGDIFANQPDFMPGF